MSTATGPFHIHMFPAGEPDEALMRIVNAACASVNAERVNLDLPLKPPMHASRILNHRADRRGHHSTTIQTAHIFTGTLKGAQKHARVIERMLNTHLPEGNAVQRVKIELATPDKAPQFNTAVDYTESHICVPEFPPFGTDSDRVRLVLSERIDPLPHKKYVNFRTDGKTYEEHKALLEHVLADVCPNAIVAKTECVFAHCDSKRDMDAGWLDRA